MKKAFPTVLISTALLIGLCNLVAAQSAPELISDAPSPVKSAVHKAAVRSRAVQINRELLAGSKGAGPHRFSLTLFEDRRYNVVLRRAKWTSARYALFVGEVENLGPSFVAIAIVDDVVNIEVQTPDKNPCRVSWQPGGGYTVNELDPELMGDCSADIEVPQPHKLKTEEPGSVAKYAPVSGTVYMDVLALYTPAARDAAGGRPALASAILNRLAYANQAHLNSGSTLQMRIVEIVELNYSESGGNMSNFLPYIRDDATVASLRDQYGADLVHLFVNTQGTDDSSSTIGYAYTPGVHGVTKWDAAVSVFVHETGHNIGCRHQYAADSGGSYEHAYSISYSFDGISTYEGRTIMWTTASKILPVFSDPNNYTRFHDPIWGDSPQLYLGDASTANNSRYIREDRMGRVDQRQPKFWLDVGASGDASAAAPTGSLSEVISDWRTATSADPNQTSEIRMASGNYSPMRITQNVRLMKWSGGSNVRVGN